MPAVYDMNVFTAIGSSSSDKCKHGRQHTGHAACTPPVQHLCMQQQPCAPPPRRACSCDTTHRARSPIANLCSITPPPLHRHAFAHSFRPSAGCSYRLLHGAPPTSSTHELLHPLAPPLPGPRSEPAPEPEAGDGAGALATASSSQHGSPFSCPGSVAIAAPSASAPPA